MSTTGIGSENRPDGKYNSRRLTEELRPTTGYAPTELFNQHSREQHHETMEINRGEPNQAEDQETSEGAVAPTISFQESNLQQISD